MRRLAAAGGHECFLGRVKMLLDEGRIRVGRARRARLMELQAPVAFVATLRVNIDRASVPEVFVPAIGAPGLGLVGVRRGEMEREVGEGGTGGEGGGRGRGSSTCIGTCI